MKTLACALVGCLCFGVAATDRHGNSPNVEEHSNQQWQWYGVNPGGIEYIAIPGPLLVVFQTLYGEDMFTANGDAQQCGQLAVMICGAGNVCCMCMYTDSCSFSCQDSEGDCAPCPRCGPVEPDYNP